MSTDKRSSPKTTRIATPTTGIDGIHHAIRALYGYKRPASYKELAKPANLSPVYISSALSASRHVGLTTLSGKRGLYKFTEAGEKYGRLLTFGKEEECRDLLRQTLLKNPWWSEIVNFLRVNEGRERESMDLVLDIEGKLGKKWSARMRGSVGNALTSILSYSGLVESKGNKIISQIGMEEKEEKNGEKPKRSMEKPTKETTVAGAPEEFAEFRLPDSFILYVRKDSYAIDFFEKQVKENSLFIPWLQLIKKRMVEEKR